MQRDSRTTMRPAVLADVDRAAIGLRPGDVLFQELPGPISVITGAGAGGAPFAHCALLTANGPGAAVTEAVFPRVRTTTLDEFLTRSLDRDARPAVTAFRLRAEFQHLAVHAVQAALASVGIPYDEAYEPGDDTLYCSELIVCVFRAANGGVDVFDEAPISFRDRESGAVAAEWVTHFRRLGLAVPDGVLGSNPAMLSRSPQLEVVYRFGGWPVPLAGQRPSPDRSPVDVRDTEVGSLPVDQPGAASRRR